MTTPPNPYDTAPHDDDENEADERERIRDEKAQRRFAGDRGDF